MLRSQPLCNHQQREGSLEAAMKLPLPSGCCGNLATPRLPSSSSACLGELRPRASSTIPLRLPRAATWRGENRGPSVQLLPQNSRAGHPDRRHPVCPLFSPAADFRIPDLEDVERPEALALSSCLDANRHPNTAHFDRGWVVGNLGSGNPKSKS